MGGQMNILDFLALIDWITPLKIAAQDIKHGGPVNLNAWTFFIHYDESIRRGWSQEHIENLLRHFRIEFWSSWTAFGEYSFSVNRRDGKRVEKLLNDHHIPIHSRSQGA
jgi:hypothetical protein